MRIKTTTKILFGVGLLLLGACQQDETTKEPQEVAITEDKGSYAKNWQEADLSQVFTEDQISYQITPTQLQEIVADKKVTQVRFIPGVVNNHVLVTIAGVDNTGAIVKQITKKPTTAITLEDGLRKLQDITFDKAGIDDKVVAYHTIQPREAHQFISFWNAIAKSKSKSNIDEVTSYNGERIRHFSMEAAMVAHMAGLSSVDHINMS